MTNLRSEDHITEAIEWNAIYTRHQHEKTIAQSLAGNGFETFLPTYNVIRQWTDRKRQITLPLFPCYVFVRSDYELRMRALLTPGVHFFVSFAGQPAPIPDTEIEAIRRTVQSGLPVEPHPFLRCGDWVRVISRPLVDIEGVLVRKKGSYRLILSAELLGKSMAVEIDAFSVRPLPRRSTMPLLSASRADQFVKHRIAG